MMGFAALYPSYDLHRKHAANKLSHHIAPIQTHDNAPRRDASGPLMNLSPRKQRAWGMPGAHCTRSLVRKV